MDTGLTSDNEGFKMGFCASETGAALETGPIGKEPSNVSFTDFLSLE
jgi:hypothetical protein